MLIPFALASFSLIACAPPAGKDVSSSGNADTGASADTGTADSDTAESDTADSDTAESDTADSDTADSADSGADSGTDTAAEGGFVTIPASTFDMGSTPGQVDQGYGVHSVTLTHAYLVGVTEVTQGQFEAVMGYNPVAEQGSHRPDLDPDHPVFLVTWAESAAYANALSDAAGLGECYTCTFSGGGGGGAGAGDVACDVGPSPYDCAGYRLLTEAEWEGAARCGADTEFAGSDSSADVAWTSENGGGSTHTVAGLAPNACGLYDMSGNVWEWTQDWYDPANYPAGAAVDPAGPPAGNFRVGRGGDWDRRSGYATVSYRDNMGLANAFNNLGFRVARSIP